MSPYERILSHVNAPELRRTYHVVLQEEYSALDKTVSDAIAALVKVEVVSEAINQLEGINHLEQGKARSDTLGEVMDSTRRSWKQEETKQEKRKKDEMDDNNNDSSNNASSSSSTTNGDEIGDREEVNKHKKRKLEVESKQVMDKLTESTAAGDAKQSVYLSLAYEALTSLSKIVDNRLQFEKEGQWAKALSNLKLILIHLSSHDSHAADNPAAEVTARALEVTVAELRNLEMSLELAKEVRSLISAISVACSKNEGLRVIFHRVRAELESLKMDFPRSITEASRNRRAGLSASAMALDDQLLFFQDLVVKIKTLSVSEKPTQIGEALNVVHHTMANDPNCARQVEVRNSAKVVKFWISGARCDNDLGDEYEKYAYNFADYGYKSSDIDHAEWQRLVDNLLLLLTSSKKREQFTAKTTKKMQDRLEAVLAEVEQWQDGISSLKQPKKTIQRFGQVICYQSKDWDPLADPNSRLCVDKLIRCIRLAM
ncbi:hypothetical protein L917_04964 [Phytophthora nicotianae]|uniref:Uncharacterized protein n=1 Tax=Phytophthora nicotianae TaxID=4792 RepID=W2LM86_PHYNI|nr:hypothetical protein L917_04964 [Phytophthora nicotianae]